MGRKYGLQDVNAAFLSIHLISNKIPVFGEFGGRRRAVTALAAKHAGMAVLGLAPAPIPL
jgi:hypothetical protein